MEILAKTDYQEVYRIKEGALLVINKFVPIKYSEKGLCIYNPKCRCYHKGCQSALKVLKEDYFDNYAEVIIPKDTVLYYNRPVIATDDKSKWEYQIKTTGDQFSGTSIQITEMLVEILNIVNA